MNSVQQTEADLHRLWQRGSLPKEGLATTDGRPVEVVYGGVWNRDSGPDFKNAILRLAGEIVKGAVEMHLQPEYWYTHSHHTDPSYNSVVLHVALEGGAPCAISREDGLEVAQILLPQEALMVVPSRRRGSQLDRLVVQSCPLRFRDATFVRETILSAAQERLTDKAARFAEQLAGASWDQILYRGVCEALGYAANQIPFRKLADCVPFDTAMSEIRWGDGPYAGERMSALLFGAAGLLPHQGRPPIVPADTELREYTNNLAMLWEEISHRRELRAMRPEEWQFFRLRPANFPTRRLAALAIIVQRFSKERFLQRLLHVFDSLAERPKRLIRELESLFLVPVEGVWARVSRLDRDPEPLSKRAATALLGRERSREIVTNVILPILYLYGVDSGDGRVVNLVREAYSVAPKLADNLLTRAMTAQLGGRSSETAPPLSAAEQQGMVQLHKLYCRPLRCEECQQLSSGSGRLTLRLRDKIEEIRRKHL